MHRRASVLLFCLAMVSALAVLAYGFVRVVQLQREGGNAANIHLLAREAALSGVNHATELLLRDFVNERFTRMDSAGVRSFAAFDFPYTSTNSPNTQDVGSTTGGAPMINVNDMPITDCFNYLLWTNSGGGHLAYRNGYMNETGRGRFYEPEFYNLPLGTAYDTAAVPAAYNAARTDPTVQTGRPAVRFGAAYPQALDRSGGMFYDSDLHRVVNPDPRAARDQSRYRLRYAVTTMDLDGMLLVNGDQDVHYGKIKTADPATVAAENPADPTVIKPAILPGDVEPVRRMVRNMHRLPAIIDAQMGWGVSEGSNRFLAGGPTSGVAAEHVFSGRGSTANVDSRAATGFAPTSFPYMYRKAGDFAAWMPSGLTQVDGAWPGPAPYAVTVGANSVTGRIDGGEPIPRVTAYPFTSHTTFVKMLLGPQFSFFDYLHATYGDGSDGVDSRGISTLGRFTPFGRGVSRRAAGEQPSRYRSRVDTPWCMNLLTTTPRMVYSMVAGYMPPGAICLGYSRTANAAAGYSLYGQYRLPTPPSTPPNPPNPVNPPLFPAPFQHPKDATILYLAYGSGDFFIGDVVQVAGEGAVGPPPVPVDHTITGVTIYPPIWAIPATIPPTLIQPQITAVTIVPALTKACDDGSSVVISTPFPMQYTALRSRDLFVKQLSPAFRYEAPLRKAAAPNGTIQPDYHVDDFWDNGGAGKYRDPAARYPGEMVFNGFDPQYKHVAGNASDTLAHWQHDNLGYYLRSVRNTPNTADLSGRWKATKSRTIGSNDPGTHAARSFWFTQSTPEWLHYVFTWYPTSASADTNVVTATNMYLGPHPDSIWEVIGQAMGATASTLQGQWYQYVNETGQTAPDKWFNNAAWVGAKATTIQDVDALFVRNLGSDPTKPNDPNPVVIWYGNSSALLKVTPTWNLAALNDQNPNCTAMAANPALMPVTGPVPNLPLYSGNDPAELGYVTTRPSYTATERTQAAELIINDFRMSFFGSSPQYGDDFRTLDLNGDGKAACSCYPANPTASVRERDLGIDQYTTAIDGNGISDPVAGDANNVFFSSTGNFILGKSRFWRVIVRGEVWDNVLSTTVDRAQLDTVLCIDPVESAHEVGPGVRDAGAGQYSTHVIAQSWVFDGIREFLPKRY